jgi:hypothetical protein
MTKDRAKFIIVTCLVIIVSQNVWYVSQTRQFWYAMSALVEKCADGSRGLVACRTFERVKIDGSQSPNRLR